LPRLPQKGIKKKVRGNNTERAGGRIEKPFRLSGCTLWPANIPQIVRGNLGNLHGEKLFLSLSTGIINSR
jgi:hypothetical protein